MNKNIISALIGLVGAIYNNGTLDTTDDVILNALRNLDTSFCDKIVEEIHKEKFSISPNCATCQSPCGNTSDFDMSKWDKETKEVVNKKLELIDIITKLAKKNDLSSDTLENIHKAIAYLGYDLKIESYDKLINELNN